MPSRLTILPRLLVLLAMLSALALVWAPISSAAPAKWGDLGHFGELESELRAPERAFGVDPEDGSLWVVDVALIAKEEQLRLQKFENVAGTWTAVASHVIGINEAPTGTRREALGVAFDPKLKRAYVLLAEERIKAPHKEEEPVASELWAFSTATSGGKIEPASGTKAGVLVPRTETELTGSPVGKTEFAPNATEKGLTLFAPGGLAVDPVNDQILITGWINAEQPVLWAISETGKIEKVWEDKTKYFEKSCGCLNSPVVTSSGKILVLGERIEGPEEVVELPSTLESSTAPKSVFWLPRSGECESRINNKEEPCPFVESLSRIESGINYEGGEMAIGPEGDLYVHTHVKNTLEGGLETGAVMVLGPSFEEIGWTGGGSWGTPTKQCAVNETDPGNLGPALVGGYEKEGAPRVFMLERGDFHAKEGPEHAKVLELGPGPEAKAENCPQGSATPPVAEAGGHKLASFPIADAITLSSKVVQANALSTEWEFEPGVKQTVAKREQQKLQIEHRFKSEGTFTVVARIHSDDLATPQIETSTKVTTVAPQVRGETATPEGLTEAALKAEVNPMGSPTTCEFQVAEAGKPFSGPGTVCSAKPGEEEKWVAETAKASGLTAGKHYHFRLLMKAGIWESSQEGAEFTIAEPGAPVAKTAPATEVTTNSALLNGSVNPEGHETKSCLFEYGTALPSGKTVPCSSSPGGGKAAVAVSAKATGLTGSTPYKYKLVDESSEGKKSEGLVESFTTLEAASAPAAETLAAVSVSQSGATLKALVNPHGEATTCRFEWGTTTGYGTSVACPTNPGSARSNIEESAPLSGLAAGTSYHFRIVAENALGKAVGGDKEFKTASSSGGGGGGNGGGNSGGGGGTTGVGGPTGGGEVLAFKAVKVASTSLSVAPSGGFSLNLSCPAEDKQCTGSITIKTVSAVAASARAARVARSLAAVAALDPVAEAIGRVAALAAHAHAAAKKAILTLATGSFSIAGGKLKSVSLHLTAKAKKLLAKVHSLRARVTIVVRDVNGTSHTSTALVTLRAAKKKHH